MLGSCLQSRRNRACRAWSGARSWLVVVQLGRAVGVGIRCGRCRLGGRVSLVAHVALCTGGPPALSFWGEGRTRVLGRCGLTVRSRLVVVQLGQAVGVGIRCGRCRLGGHASMVARVVVSPSALLARGRAPDDDVEEEWLGVVGLCRAGGMGCKKSGGAESWSVVVLTLVWAGGGCWC